MTINLKSTFFSLSLVFVSIFFLPYCGKDDQVNIVDTPAPGSDPAQYGTPFSGVPDIADIQMYEVNPRVFSPERNLDGITSRLDSLQTLGINVVWLMPINQTGSERSVGSPYAIKDYFAIHTDYGNLADLRKLVDRAHALNMAVMMDWVANHTSWDNGWIAKTSWYQTDGSGNIIHPPGTNWLDVAQLDFTNEEMRQEMIKAMKYWVLAANIDGYRCDYASGVPNSFWRAAIDSLRSIPGRDLIMFAEADDKSLLNTGFDIIFGWPFYGRLIEIFEGRSASQLYTRHVTEYSGLEEGKHVLRWITNHDQHAWDATPQQIFGGSQAAMAAFILASHMGGIPLIYNGQEIDVPNQLPFFEGNNVTINWNSNVEKRETYRRVMNFRKNSEALKRGALADFSSANVVVFTRKQQEEEVLVMVNVRNQDSSFSLPDNLENSLWQDAYDLSEVSLGSTLSLGAYEYRVLKR